MTFPLSTLSMYFQEAIQHLIIDRINDCVQEILEDVTLKDLVDAYEGYQDSVEGMYYI